MTTARTPSSARVTILMAVYNGSDNLHEQLDSLAGQTHRNWRLVASDDDSRDGSAELIRRFGEAGHEVHLRRGPCQGAAENFLSLIRALPEYGAENGWTAFSDQDDVWLPDKLHLAMSMLWEHPQDAPALYCSRTWITDARLEGRRLSMARPKPPGFRNALVQNVVAGNTIVLNPAATRLVSEAAQEAGKIVIHDWWIYQIVTGAGGTVLHDDRPTLLYRQHAVNQIGANDTFRARMVRVGMILQGRFKEWNDINIAALAGSAHRFAPEERQVYETFAALRCHSVPRRLADLLRLGLYRQSRVSTVALWISALIGRL